MTLTAYWWAPARSPRSAAGEAVRHGRAWAHLLRHGGLRAKNFGDEVSALVVAELVGQVPVWRPVAQAELICIGSIIDTYVRSGGAGMILGSGVREPANLRPGAVDPDLVLLVRGRRTRTAAGLAQDIPLGDPGLVVPQIVAGGAGPRRGVVVVPHFAAPGDRANRELLGACRALGWRVVLPNRPPEEVARSIAAADLVITSSLHGLVFADAYGIPAQQVSMAEGVPSEPGFKYDDYASALDATSEPVPLAAVLATPDPVRWIERVERRSALVADRLPDVVEGIYRAARPLR